MEEKGFTLLEVIIAITITGIILSSIIVFLQVGLSTWERADISEEWNQQLRILESKIKTDTSRLFYPPLYENNIFKGDYQGLEFLIRDNGQIKKVSYYIDYHHNTLIREESLYAGNNSDEIEKLLFFEKQNIRDINIEFYDREYRYWTGSWPDYKQELPGVIRFNISLEDVDIPSIKAEIFQGKIF